MYKKFEMELAGRTLRVDVGRVAKQANGAALMHYGDTVVLSTATASEKPRGGIAIAIQSELNVPVKYIGIGEQIDDLQKFDPNSYVNALFADFDMRSDVEILVDENIENIPKDDDLFDMN